MPQAKKERKLPAEIASLAEMQPGKSKDEYRRYLKDYELYMEFKHCQLYAPDGVYLFPSVDDPMRVWEGVIFMHKGWWADGVFRFSILIPEDYPDRPPQVKFNTDMFHPLIHSTSGELDLRACVPVWRPKKDRLSYVLMFIKRIFHAKTLEQYIQRRASADPHAHLFNPHATDLFKRAKVRFMQECKHSAERSDEAVYTNEGGVPFRRNIPAHQEVANRIMTAPDVKPPGWCFESWFEDGVHKISDPSRRD